ncbi:chaplin [Streptomyces sp. NBC_01433]|uniref:chaplin n=1 Tax=Streptomyces sp. NBC_01433 TaxID=2903864 RepID=UPI002B1CC4D5|nr:chaplin [Streptomyces sp. NBC_01433]
MRQVTRKGLITMAAAGGVLALSGGYAHADAGAAGGASNSPGVLSGNSVQIPIEVPINACGNSVDVVGLLNPTFGNHCENGSSGSASGPGAAGSGSSGNHAAAGSTTAQAPGGDAGKAGNSGAGSGTGRHRAPGASAEGTAQGSPGILSGNNVAAPIDIPVNACGNSITIGGLLNPTFGNSCANDPVVSPPHEVPEVPVTPGTPVTPPVNSPPEPNVPVAQLHPGEQLAQTGGGGLDLLIPAGAGLLLAGAGTVLYRRSRSAA